MGRAYLAYDEKLRRTVAVKAMRTEDPGDVKRHAREVEIAASLRRPNIAAVFDAHSVDGVFLIAMPFVEGRTLEGPPVPAREAAHEAGIIHRDLKPANLMRTPDGHVYVLDFGIARKLGRAALTDPGMLVGTPAFMSPEQAHGRDLDARSDVYSLGAS